MIVPEITSETEEGFVDLIFLLADQKTRADGSCEFVARGVHCGAAVAIRVVLSRSWSSRPFGQQDEIPSNSGIVTFESVGRDSDALIVIIDELYGTKIQPTRMKSQTRFAARTLGDRIEDLRVKKAHIKLFFEPADEDAEKYAELYTNIDADSERIEIREKDPGYRSAIVRALANAAW